MGRERWDRLPNESSQEYSAFCAYMNLPVNERSVKRAYAVTQGKDPNDTASHTAVPQRVGQWMRDNDWVDRAACWDEKIAKERREATLQGIKIEAMKLGENEFSSNRKLQDVRDKALDKLGEMLDEPLDPKRWNYSNLGTLLRSVIETSNYLTGTQEKLDKQTTGEDSDSELEREIKRITEGAENS